MWEKEKLLVTSNFSFSHSVSKGYCVGMGKIFSKRKIIGYSKLKEFVDDCFKFVENIRKFSKQQFLLFPECFEKTCTANMLKLGFSGKGLSGLDTLYTCKKWIIFTLNWKFPSNAVIYMEKLGGEDNEWS